MKVTIQWYIIWLISRTSPFSIVFGNDIIITLFLVTWLLNLHILWNLPKAISLQSFSTVDCLPVKFYREITKTQRWRHSDVISWFWDSKFPFFCETGYKISTCQVSNPLVIWIKFYRGFYKAPQQPLWRHYDVTSQHFVFKIAHFVELKRGYQPAKFHRPRLSGSNFTRAGGTPPPDLHALKMPSPYKVNFEKNEFLSSDSFFFTQNWKLTPMSISAIFK